MGIENCLNFEKEKAINKINNEIKISNETSTYIDNNIPKIWNGSNL